MSNILSNEHAGDVADMVVGVLEDEGYSAEEIIPGLVQAIVDLAEKQRDSDAYLDAAANLLADGGVV